jgi:hypothetical protein
LPGIDLVAMSVDEKVLLKKFRLLPEAQKQALADYAEFLSQRYAEEPEPVPQQPLDIPRPQQETVIKAIQRLSKTYPMLDSKELFEKTSTYMMRNLMQGEDNDMLIDEMEVFFKERYQAYLNNRDKELKETHS